MAKKVQRPMKNIFDIVHDGDCTIVIPLLDLGESVFEQHHSETRKILDALDQPTAKHLVMDFQKTHQFGSTALGFFVKLWKRVCAIQGRMAFCNLTDQEREILQITKLDHLWALCKTRDEALKTVRKVSK
jgi:anti-anti-sigma factor